MGLPLDRRFPRMVRHNLGRYLGLLFLLVFSVGLSNGFMQAASNTMDMMRGMRDSCTVEDGRFTTDFKASSSSIDAVERLGATVHENFSYDASFGVPGQDVADSTVVRLYGDREGFDEVTYAEGSAPSDGNQVALDRVFMQNHDLKLGDTVELDGHVYTICGVATFSDYVTLFKNNSDLVYNALTFGVGQLSPDALDDLARDNKTYTYSYVFDDRSLSTADRVGIEEDMVDVLTDHGVVISDLVDYEYNQSISYAMTDNQNDLATAEELLIILTLVLAFVFIMLTNASIEQESAAIGTLLAMGYRKKELVRHYLTLPVIIGLIGCVLGDIFGALVVEGVICESYYGTYSFPPYVHGFHPEAYLFTTILPLVLLIAVMLVGLLRKLRLSPLRFLRRELGRQGRGKRSLNLPERFGYIIRFRIRVLHRNLSHFVTLFFGILVANMLLLFGLSMLPSIESYTAMRKDGLVAQHLYTLKDAVEIDGGRFARTAYGAAEDIATSDITHIDYDNVLWQMVLAQTVDQHAHPVNRYENSQEAIDQAEKFAAVVLQVPRRSGDQQEEVTVYGIQKDSRYWSGIDVGDGKVVADRGLLEKCGFKTGEQVTYTDKTTDKTYAISIDAVTDDRASTSLYMDRGTFNELFDKDPDYFNGYASNEELRFDERYLSQDFTPVDVDKIAEQMRTSYGDVMDLVLDLSIPIFVILIYLLTKTVIDRSARSISYMKVFGYRNREIDRLYLRSITVAVIASLLLSVPILVALLSVMFKEMMASMNGNFLFSVSGQRMVLDVLIGIATYLIVALLHARHVKKVPLSLALKVTE
ncbi:MAG: FtsX-like permease family protein [Actinomycetota bacterium]|nr:FtsX-like permease family protein [Actinomycetota bacterium]